VEGGFFNQKLIASSKMPEFCGKWIFLIEDTLSSF